MGSNSYFLTDLRNNSTSANLETGAFHDETFLTVGKIGSLSSSVGLLLISRLLKKNVAALSRFSNLSQSSCNLSLSISRGTGQNEGPLLSNDFSSGSNSREERLIGKNFSLHKLEVTRRAEEKNLNFLSILTFLEKRLFLCFCFFAYLRSCNRLSSSQVFLADTVNTEEARRAKRLFLTLNMDL